LAHWYVIGICKLGSFDTAHDLFLEVAEVKTYHLYCTGLLAGNLIATQLVKVKPWIPCR